MNFSLADRVRQPEVMDQPDLDPTHHRQALRGLQRVNRLSGTSRHLWNRICQLRPVSPEMPLRILDLACGGGDVLVNLAAMSSRQNVPMEFVGRDLSTTAIRHAREQAIERGVSNIRFEEEDAIEGAVEPLSFDVVYCTLFLHHLDPPEATRLLARMAMLSRQIVLIDDLRRTKLGYLLAWIGCRLVSRSPIVHVDGPMSVRAAFTEKETQQLAAAAGLTGGSTTRHWPQRFLFEWCRS